MMAAPAIFLSVTCTSSGSRPGWRSRPIVWPEWVWVQASITFCAGMPVAASICLRIVSTDSRVRPITSHDTMASAVSSA